MRRGSRALAWVIVAVAALYFLLPLAATFLFSLRGRKGALSFVAYGNVIADPRFLATFGFSLGMAVASIAAGLALVIPAAVWVRLRAPRARRAMESLTMLPFVIPPIVLVFGLIKLYSRPPLYLTGSPVLLCAGYVVLVFPYLYRSVDTGLSAMDARSLYEAARTLGASLPRTMLSVIVPGLRGAILGSIFMAFAIVMGELTMAVILSWQAFAPYIAMVGRGKAYEPAALTVMSFLMTWLSIMAINLAASRFPGAGAAVAPAVGRREE
jgi:putative spermidine/putrescine transport system permease protein